jgi:hypothetical protein
MIKKSLHKIKENYRALAAGGVGLASPFVVSASENTSDIHLQTHQLTIPNYHTVMYDMQNAPSYHICGYGSSSEETLTRANNLDDTFLYWSNYNDYEEKNKILDTLVSDETEEFKISEVKTTKEEFVALFTQLKSKLNYLSFIDITPIEVEKYGYKAVRMVAPELIPMCFPSAPYENHPYFIKRGGIKNANFPHPLP